MGNVVKEGEFFKSRRGYGAILGGSIIVMIILAGFGFYILNNRAQNQYHQTVGEVQSEDIDQFQEDLIFENIVNSQDGEITFDIINMGPKPVTIDYVGVFGTGSLDLNPYLYERYIENSEDPSVLDDFTLSIPPSETYSDFLIEIPGVNPAEIPITAHIITERGNVIPVKPSGLNLFNEFDTEKMALAEIFGYILPDYDSFAWIDRNEDEVFFKYDPPEENEWDYSWKIDDAKNKDYFVFKIDVEYVPAKNYVIMDRPLQLGNNSGIYFAELDGQLYRQCYLVYGEETFLDPPTNKDLQDVTIKQLNVDTNGDHLPDENMVILYPPEKNPDGSYKTTVNGNILWYKTRLYFAVSEGMGDPPDDTTKIGFAVGGGQVRRFKSTLGLYEDLEVDLDTYEPFNYAQAYPLIAMELEG